MDGLEKIVHNNLNSAIDGGYEAEMSVMSVDDLVADLQAYAEDCEPYSAEQLKPHVESWLALVRKT
jgi:hypothetical protein